MSKNRFREISLSVEIEIAKFEYFAKVIIYIRNLQITCFKMICNTFIFLKFEIFSKSCSAAIGEPFRENCS